MSSIMELIRKLFAKAESAASIGSTEEAAASRAARLLGGG